MLNHQSRNVLFTGSSSKLQNLYDNIFNTYIGYKNATRKLNRQRGILEFFSPLDENIEQNTGESNPCKLISTDQENPSISVTLTNVVKPNPKNTNAVWNILDQNVLAFETEEQKTKPYLINEIDGYKSGVAKVGLVHYNKQFILNKCGKDKKTNLFPEPGNKIPSHLEVQTLALDQAKLTDSLPFSGSNSGISKAESVAYTQYILSHN